MLKQILRCLIFSISSLRGGPKVRRGKPDGIILSGLPRRLLRRLLAITLLTITVNAKAENSVDYDDIKITAENLVLDKTQNISRFYTNVVVWCGDLIIKTDELVVKTSEVYGKKSINHLIIPHKLSAMKQDMTEVILSDKAEYKNDARTLVFGGHTYVQKDDRVVKCDELVYAIPNTKH